MKHSFYLVTAAMVLLASCTQPFKKTDNGIEYKIISDGKGKQVGYGQFFEIQFDQQYKSSNKDTLLFTSKDYSNQILALDSVNIPPVYYNIFKQVKAGDSVVIKQLTDSIMKQGQVAPFMKKGAHIIAHYKIVNVYQTRESADSAYKLLMESARVKDSLKSVEQLVKDDKTIADYLAQNKIQATKAPAGTYVQIIAPGEGAAADTSKVLKVLYSGKSMEDGQVFDSNMDPKFGHTDPLPVFMNAAPGSEYGVIKGWTDGLSLLKKGGKANLYIPSSLAYGKQGRGEKIKPNANLMFEVEVVDMVTEEQAKKEMAAMQQKMEAEQQRMLDSMRKSKPQLPNQK
jgi:FKBP-type peptidyl-prolyl cis-trans isomerase FkpA